MLSSDKIDPYLSNTYPVTTMAYEKKVFLSKAYKEKMLRKSKFRDNTRVRDKKIRFDRRFKDIQLPPLDAV